MTMDMIFLDQQGRRRDIQKLKLPNRLLYCEIGRRCSWERVVLCPYEGQEKLRSDVRSVTRHVKESSQPVPDVQPEQYELKLDQEITTIPKIDFDEEIVEYEDREDHRPQVRDPEHRDAFSQLDQLNRQRQPRRAEDLYRNQEGSRTERPFLINCTTL